MIAGTHPYSDTLNIQRSPMKRFTLLALLCAAAPPTFAAGTVHLLQKPAMNKTEIVFSYAGDLWSVPRQGGMATRLTAGAGAESRAAFSPDGNTLAFSGEYDGNIDVFTVPVSGGVPKRVTYHPDADRVVGWTPDGQRILFCSTRQSYSRYTQLFTVPPEGGLPEVLPLPMAFAGAYSPDAKRMVYQPLDGGQFSTDTNNFVSWRRYRGGRASYLWIVNFAGLTTQKIPRTDSNDFNAMWIGDKIYFLSDRNGPVTLFRYDPQSRKLDEVIRNTGKDIIYASDGPAESSTNNSARSTSSISRAAANTPCPSRSPPTSPKSARASRTSRARSAISASLPPASAPSWRRTARSSPLPPRRATSAISPTRPA